MAITDNPRFAKLSPEAKQIVVQKYGKLSSEARSIVDEKLGVQNEPPKSYLDKVMDYAPVAGGIMGAMAGGIPTSGVGAIPGATMGGMAGEALKQMYNRKLDTQNVVKQGAIEGAGMMGGELISKGIGLGYKGYKAIKGGLSQIKELPDTIRGLKSAKDVLEAKPQVLEEWKNAIAEGTKPEQQAVIRKDLSNNVNSLRKNLQNEYGQGILKEHIDSGQKAVSLEDVLTPYKELQKEGALEGNVLRAILKDPILKNAWKNPELNKVTLPELNQSVRMLKKGLGVKPTQGTYNQTLGEFRDELEAFQNQHWEGMKKLNETYRKIDNLDTLKDQLTNPSFFTKSSLTRKYATDEGTKLLENTLSPEKAQQLKSFADQYRNVDVLQEQVGMNKEPIKKLDTIIKETEARLESLKKTRNRVAVGVATTAAGSGTYGLYRRFH